MAQKILVVDDDAQFLELARFVLEQEGYEVITAIAGFEGLKRAKEENPHLLILDIMLPDIDGYQVCRYLRADSKTAHLPIIMLTAKAGPRDQMEGFDAGADSYITKPFSLSELVTRVRSLLFFASVENVG